MRVQIKSNTFESTEDRQIRGYLNDLLAAHIPLTRIAVESGVSASRSQHWIAGGHDPEIVPVLTAWKIEGETTTSLASGFVMTPTAKRIIQAFDRARQARNSANWEQAQQRGIALIYGASGAGKTDTAKWYRTHINQNRRQGEWPVVFVRCTGYERGLSEVFVSIFSALVEEGLGAYCHHNKREAILNHVPAGGLVIFDEAQLLSLRRLDELRYFPDQCGIAIAFLGNMAGYKSLVDAKIGQITSRVGGARVVIDTPCEGDVDALLDAWGIGGRKVRELALIIGMQDGGLRLLSETASTARLFIKVSGKPIDADIFKAAAMACGAWGG